MLKSGQINHFLFLMILFASIILQFSCSPTRHLPKNKSLHTKTNIIIEYEGQINNKSELKNGLYKLQKITEKYMDEENEHKINIKTDFTIYSNSKTTFSFVWLLGIS